MVDFHAHVLPNMDDGARDTEESLRMLGDSASQGVKTVVATPHFYADSEDPAGFLARRTAAAQALKQAWSKYSGPPLPELRLGAEVLYFPGMSEAGELRALLVEGSYCLLIEPPMHPWTDSMLDEIELTGQKLRCVPVIAHIDRYMRLLRDETLIDRLHDRRLLVQANAGFFLRPETGELALRLLNQGRLHLLGSDCHNMSSRPPNMGKALRVLRELGAEEPLRRLSRNAEFLMHQRNG